MTTILYNIVISPLEYLIESLFSVFFSVIGLDVLCSVVFISFAVTMLCLPLYYRADRLHEEEEAKLAEIKPYIDKIKRNFKGDEQFFMLKTLYRQNNYNPIMALRNSISLLLQIPFFIAAYHFFSNQPLFVGYSYGVFGDLSKPDMLLSLSRLNINVLPILMTVINIISCETYLKADGIKPRIQPYAFALFFLIVLYDSPAILVLYWTFNNFFYLLKNKFMDNSNPKKFAFWLSQIMLILGVITYASGHYGDFENEADYYSLMSHIAVALVVVELLSWLIYKKAASLKNLFVIPQDSNPVILTLLAGSLGFIVLQGLIIPVEIISSDPGVFLTEFGNAGAIYFFVSENLTIIAGLYLFWGTVVLGLIRKESRACFEALVVAVYLFSLFNYLTIGSNIGTISYDLIFDSQSSLLMLSGSTIVQIVNLLVLAGILAAVGYAYRKSWAKPVTYIVLVLLISEIAVAVTHTMKLVNEVAYINEQKKQVALSGALTKNIELSKTGKNVIVLFLDRFVGAFLPQILEEKPELRKNYSGFTFYPNTVSFFHSTILGYPPLTGGYEYTPFEMDKSNKPVFDNLLEASVMLPTLFHNEKYSSTVVDSVWDNDVNLCILKDMNFVNYYTSKGLKYIKLSGKYNSRFERLNSDSAKVLKKIQRKFYLYSFFNIAAKPLKKFLYDEGNYLLAPANANKDVYSSDHSFLSAYSSLYYLNDITNCNAAQDTFTLIHSDLAHNMAYLQYPDYTYAKPVTDIGPNRFGDEKAYKSYHTSMASIILVGKFMEYLKQSGVYDNTRIIIVADHGNMFIKIPGLSEYQNAIVVQYNPLLMVKDFNNDFELATDNTFMTNADVPYLATKGLIENARNPFTGKSIATDLKNDGVDIYENRLTWKAEHFTSNRVIQESSYSIRHVKGNIFDRDSWKLLKHTYK